MPSIFKPPPAMQPHGRQALPAPPHPDTADQTITATQIESERLASMPTLGGAHNTRAKAASRRQAVPHFPTSACTACRRKGGVCLAGCHNPRSTLVPRGVLCFICKEEAFAKIAMEGDLGGRLWHQRGMFRKPRFERARQTGTERHRQKERNGGLVRKNPRFCQNVCPENLLSH